MLCLAVPLTAVVGMGGLMLAAGPTAIKLCNSNVKLLNLSEGGDVLI